MGGRPARLLRRGVLAAHRGLGSGGRQCAPARARRGKRWAHQGAVRDRWRRRRAARQGRDLVRRHRGSAPQPRGGGAALGLRPRAGRSERFLGGGTGVRACVGWKRGGKADLLHGALPHQARPDPVPGRGRTVPRGGRTGPHGGRVPQLLGVLAVGHVPGRPPAVHPDGARPRERLRAVDAGVRAGVGLATRVVARGERNQHDDRLPRDTGHCRRIPQGVQGL